MKIQRTTRNRRGERGQSFLLVVAGMFTILALAAFAIDIASLYAAKSEAQKAADAAALAAAKTFVMSSSTSGTGAPDTPADVCVSNSPLKMANAMASAAAAANTVGGAAAAITNLTCTLGNAQNPQVSVTVGRTDLPLYFSRVFGNKIATVNATAKAEAYNNSGETGTAFVQTASVKPWLVPNCLYSNCAANQNYFFQAGTYALNNPTAYIGQQLPLVPYSAAHPNPYATYYVADPPAGDQPNVCPSTSAVSCSSVGGSNYINDIACGNQHKVSCGDSLPVSANTLPEPTDVPSTMSAVECLIHADAPGMNQGQDDVPLGAATPVVITKGFNNPNSNLLAGATLGRSDSVVTVPVFNLVTDPCTGGVCGGNVTVIGFLQLAIRDLSANPLRQGTINTVVVNAVGCNPGGSGTPVSGGGVSPVPVRLIQ